MKEKKQVANGSLGVLSGVYRDNNDATNTDDGYADLRKLRRRRLNRSKGE